MKHLIVAGNLYEASNNFTDLVSYKLDWVERVRIFSLARLIPLSMFL